MPGVGPFKLGMLAEEVRYQAAENNLQGDGVPNKAWCLPPQAGHREPIIIKTPSMMRFDEPSNNPLRATYIIYFSPFGSKLKADYIDYEKGPTRKVKKLNDEQRANLIDPADNRKLLECSLTNNGYKILKSYEIIDGSPLQKALGRPIYSKLALPDDVQRDLISWEHMILVRPESEICDDCSSRSAYFEAAWKIPEGYAVSYQVGEDGNFASASRYIVVMAEGRKLAWVARPDAFISKRLRGQQSPIHAISARRE